MKNNNHPVPAEYHKLFAIGETDRRGNIIDFKVPPIILDIDNPISHYRDRVFEEHVHSRTLPKIYTEDVNHFIILRPTALLYRAYVREELIKSGLIIKDEFELDNFRKLSDSIYELDSYVSFHWKWRVITQVMHNTGIQNQDKAIVFLFENNDCINEIMNIKKRIRINMGEIPVLIRYNNISEIALGIHHLHSPDLEHLPGEYNALMHAKNKTSIFSKV